MINKRKMLASLLATGMVFSSLSFAGPIHTYEGNYSFVSVAQADSVSAFADRLTGIYNYLNDQEKATVQVARDNLFSLTNAEWTNILGSTVVTNIDTKTGTTGRAVQIAKDIAAIIYDTQGNFHTNISNFRTAYAADFDAVFGTEITVDSMFAFFNTFEEKLTMIVMASVLLNSEATFDSLVRQAIDEAKAVHPTFDGALMNGIGIGADGLIGIKDRLNQAIDPAKDARNALMKGVARGKGGAISGSSTVTVGTTANYQYKVNYGGSVLDVTPVVVWQSSNPTVATVSAGALSALAEGTTTITATVFDGVVIGDFVVTVGPASSGGGGVILLPPPEETTTDVGQAISDFSSSLEGATTEEVLTVINEQLVTIVDSVLAVTDPDQSVSAANQLVSTLNTVLKKVNQTDVSGDVQVNGTQATISLGSGLTDTIVAAKALIDDLAAKTQSLNAEVELSKQIVIAANTGLDSNRLTLNSDVFNALKENNLELAIALNGEVELALDPNSFSSEAEIDVNKQTTTEIPGVSGALASAVYEFKFTDGGAELETFTNPVELSFAVNMEGVDPELLTLVHMDGDLVEYVGGKVGADGMFYGQATHFSSYAVVENKVAFDDLAPVQNWAGRSIEVMAAKGVLAGKGEGEYDPNGDVTRAEFAKMLVATFGLQAGANAVEFNDVKAGVWYAPYVAVAASQGIITGYADGTFKPNASITRAEMATMAARAMKVALKTRAVADPDALLGTFTDSAQVHETMKADVALAVKKGIVQGVGAEVLDPKGTSTRAQAAVIIYRMFVLK